MATLVFNKVLEIVPFPLQGKPLETLISQRVLKLSHKGKAGGNTYFEQVIKIVP